MSAPSFELMVLVFGLAATRHREDKRSLVGVDGVGVRSATTRRHEDEHSFVGVDGVGV
jgi:hypothetical protein